MTVPGPAAPAGKTVAVDLNQCQSYGQCVQLAPGVFRFAGEESLEYDHLPPASEDENVERAGAACPVQAIIIGRACEEITVGERR